MSSYDSDSDDDDIKRIKEEYERAIKEAKERKKAMKTQAKVINHDLAALKDDIKTPSLLTGEYHEDVLQFDPSGLTGEWRHKNYNTLTKKEIWLDCRMYREFDNYTRVDIMDYFKKLLEQQDFKKYVGKVVRIQATFEIITIDIEGYIKKNPKYLKDKAKKFNSVDEIYDTFSTRIQEVSKFATLDYKEVYPSGQGEFSGLKMGKMLLIISEIPTRRLKAGTYIPLPGKICDKGQTFNGNLINPKFVESKKFKDDGTCFVDCIDIARRKEAQRIFNQEQRSLKEAGLPHQNEIKYDNWGSYNMKKRLERSKDLEREGKIVADGIVYSGIKFPIDINGVKLFEFKNPRYRINIFSRGSEGAYDFPFYVSDNRNKHALTVNLLLIKEFDDKRDKLVNIDEDEEYEEKEHFVLISNKDAYLGKSIGNSNQKTYFCDRCCSYNVICNDSKAYERSVREHSLICDKVVEGETVMSLPKYDNRLKKFTKIKYKIKVPISIFIDSETTQNEKGEHTAASWYAYCYTDYEVLKEFEGPTKIFLGYKCTDLMVNELYKLCSKIKEKITSTNIPIIMTDEDIYNHQRATHCYFCEEAFTYNDKIVRDHCHLTGKYRGAAHKDCNTVVNHKSFKIPVYAHNLRGFDSNLLISPIAEIVREKNKEIAKRNEVIKKRGTNKIERGIYAELESYNTIKMLTKNSSGAFRSLKFGNVMEFKDSLECYGPGSSLEKIVSGIINAIDKDQYDTKVKEIFKELFDVFGEKAHLLLRKGVFPYEWFSDIKKLDYIGLPPIECFYNRLTNKHITQEEYDYAQVVYKEFNCQSFKDYHNIYLKTDVLLLGCAFRLHTKIGHELMGIDIMHCISLPGFSEQAFFKSIAKSEVKEIELFYEGQEEMLAKVEKSVRGGNVFVGERYCKGNYSEKEEENIEIVYLDANSLYPSAMREKLPIGDYKYENVSIFNESYIKTCDMNGSRGYQFEVKLSIPIQDENGRNLHDYFNDYPPLITHAEGKYSPWMQALSDEYGMGKNGVKLIASLNTVDHYQIHGRLLQLLLNLGVKLEAVYSVISFRQEAFMKDYVEMIGAKRAAEKDELKKNFYKLLMNSLFGKMIQNVHKYTEVELVYSKQQYERLTSSNYFKNANLINSKTLLIEKKKEKDKMNIPIIVGASILDLSKYHMFNFHYNVMKPRFDISEEKCAKVMYTDTDSLIYKIKGTHLFKAICNDEELQEWFDCSNYDNKDFPISPELVSKFKKNKGKLGLFKNETSWRFINEFVGLAPKQYSIDAGEDSMLKTKGVSKYAVTKSGKKIDHDVMIECLKTNERQEAFQRDFKRGDGKITSVDTKKYAVSTLTDKRWVKEDKITSYAHGHYKIDELKNQQ